MRKKRTEKENIVPIRKKKRKPASGRVKALLAICIVLLFGMAGVILWQCPIDTIIVNGNETYTKDEVEAAVRENCMNNTVFYTVYSFFGKNAYLPFIEELDITFLEKNTILVEVKEKMRAGMIQEMSEYCYFDKDGILLETSSVRIKDVPLITGLQMNECILNEKMEPKEANVFPVILKMSQLIMKYQIPVSEIQFNSITDIRLRSNSIWIAMGGTEELDAKMAELPSVLESLYGKQGELNMEHFSEENKVISFKAN
ncbi:MAG: hypothetical protein E7253_05275 [Lachnospiraceae bacterium]|nr:hypothetical protein [Lachnospiraceae bacterium]